MALPSPTCTVNGSATPQAVAAGAPFTIALAATFGVQSWSLSCISTDETNTAAAVNATLVVNQTTKTATCTATASTGSAMIFQSQVGVGGTPGIDGNRQTQSALTTTFKVNVPTPGGLNVLAANEELEQSATFGWISEINPLIRGISGPVGFTAVVAKSTSFVAAPNTYYLITASGPITMTIPTMTTGQVVGFVDVLAESGTYNITVAPPAAVQLEIPNKIGAPSGVYGTAGTSFVCSSNGANASWMSDGSTHYSVY